MFTQSCFIRKNTPELIKKLEELGYKLQFKWSQKDNVIQIGFGKYYTFPDQDYNRLQKIYTTPDVIDCVTNEPLFLAIAALRDDSDYMQWFTDSNNFILNTNVSFVIEQIYHGKYHKATVPELIEHFKDVR